MRWTKYFVLSCTAWACCHALSLPQATPLPHKRTFGNLTSHDNALANATANGLGNGTASAGKFGMKFAAGGGTITMDVGPLSAFTQTTVSKATVSQCHSHLSCNRLASRFLPVPVMSSYQPTILRTILRYQQVGFTLSSFNKRQKICWKSTRQYASRAISAIPHVSKALQQSSSNRRLIYKNASSVRPHSYCPLLPKLWW